MHQERTVGGSAPHPATIAQRKLGPHGAAGPAAPHPATVAQRKTPGETERVDARELAARWSRTAQPAAEAPALNEVAQKIHSGAGGDLSKSTTGIAKHSDDSYTVVTQLAVDKVTPLATSNLPKDATVRVYKTHGAGYHTEVSAAIYTTSNALPAVTTITASQSFCPNCWKFVNYRGWTTVGKERETQDSKWVSPEKHAGVELPKNATYPYYRYKDETLGKVITFTKKAKYDRFMELMLAGNQDGAKALFNADDVY